MSAPTALHSDSGFEQNSAVPAYTPARTARPLPIRAHARTESPTVLERIQAQRERTSATSQPTPDTLQPLSSPTPTRRSPSPPTSILRRKRLIKRSRSIEPCSKKVKFTSDVSSGQSQADVLEAEGSSTQHSQPVFRNNSMDLDGSPSLDPLSTSAPQSDETYRRPSVAPQPTFQSSMSMPQRSAFAFADQPVDDHSTNTPDSHTPPTQILHHRTRPRHVNLAEHFKGRRASANRSTHFKPYISKGSRKMHNMRGGIHPTSPRRTAPRSESPFSAAPGFDESYKAGFSAVNRGNSSDAEIPSEVHYVPEADECVAAIPDMGMADGTKQDLESDDYGGSDLRDNPYAYGKEDETAIVDDQDIHPIQGDINMDNKNGATEVDISPELEPGSECPRQGHDAYGYGEEGETVATGDEDVNLIQADVDMNAKNGTTDVDINPELESNIEHPRQGRDACGVSDLHDEPCAYGEEGVAAATEDPEANPIQGDVGMDDEFTKKAEIDVDINPELDYSVGCPHYNNTQAGMAGEGEGEESGVEIVASDENTEPKVETNGDQCRNESDEVNYDARQDTDHLACRNSDSDGGSVHETQQTGCPRDSEDSNIRMNDDQEWGGISDDGDDSDAEQTSTVEGGSEADEQSEREAEDITEDQDCDESEGYHDEESNTEDEDIVVDEGCDVSEGSENDDEASTNKEHRDVGDETSEDEEHDEEASGRREQQSFKLDSDVEMDSVDFEADGKEECWAGGEEAPLNCHFNSDAEMFGEDDGSWAGCDVNQDEGGQDNDENPSPQAPNPTSNTEHSGFDMDTDTDDGGTPECGGGRREREEMFNDSFASNDGVEIDDELLQSTIDEMMDGPEDARPTRRDFAIFLAVLRDMRQARHNATSAPSSARGSNVTPPPRSRETGDFSRKTFDVRHNDTNHLRLKVNGDSTYNCLFSKLDLTQREVRLLVAEILDLEESPIKVPTPLQIQVFTKSRKQVDGPDLDNLKLNLANKSVVNVWNKRAAAIFAQRFITEAEFGCKDPKAVSKAFMSHLKTLQTRYRKALRDEEENADLEYEMDMRMRKVAKARENRRRGTRMRRSEACIAYSKTDATMTTFIPVWEKLSFQGMSGDESDHADGEERYAYTNLPWRNPATEVKQWFKNFDYLHLSTRFTADDRATSGKFPHIRINSTRIERHATPVPGLPRNFYDPVWLERMDDFQVRELDVQPSIDLSFSQKMLYIAARFSNVKNEKSKPLPHGHSSLPPKH